MRAKIYDDDNELVVECDIPESLAVFIEETFEVLTTEGDGEPGGGPTDPPPEPEDD
jgi:hypothetical protein